MKWLQKRFDSMKPLFEEGGRFHRFRPLFEAGENFFFAPAARTSNEPHIRDPLDVKRYMSMAILGLAPAAAASIYFFGLRVIAMIIVSYAVGGAVESLFAIVRKEEINEGFLVTGLIFPLVLPPTMPLWMVGAGVAFGVIFGKELFGGTGRNLFNPALVGRCFLALSYPSATTSGWVLPGEGLWGRATEYVSASATDAISAATPLIEAKQGTFAALTDLLSGRVTGCAGETSAILIIAGGLFLLATGVGSWRTVGGIVIGTLGLGQILHMAQPDAFATGIWHVAAGGLLFGAFFMATDPVTSPFSKGGKWVYGLFIGMITILIRNFTGYVEGVMFAILLGNIIAPLIDEVATRVHVRRLANEK